jgi:outer membrane immunogenic protein
MKTVTVSTLAVSAFTLISAPVSAADMAVKTPPSPLPPSAPAYTWTGCYVGGNLGGAWDHISTERIGQVTNPVTPQDFGSDSGSASVGGIQGGCDYQINSSWVLGIRGQGDWGKINSSHSEPPFPTFSYNTSANDFATITGRIGYILLPQTLLYVQGGWAHTHDHLDVTIPTVGFLSEFADVDFSGWTVGGGVEWAITPYLSLFAEYNYLGFDTKTVTFTIGPTAVPPGPDIINHTQNVQTALVGANFRFNWWGGSAGKGPPLSAKN